MSVKGTYQYMDPLDEFEREPFAILFHVPKAGQLLVSNVFFNFFTFLKHTFKHAQYQYSYVSHNQVKICN